MAVGEAVVPVFEATASRRNARSPCPTPIRGYATFDFRVPLRVSKPVAHSPHASAVQGDPIEPAQFVAALRELGYDFFTGVPCSLVAGLIAELERNPETEYYAETREDAAVGLACGAMMAGKKPYRTTVTVLSQLMGVSEEDLLSTPTQHTSRQRKAANG